MSNAINHIKTAKGYYFNRFAKNVNVFYCEKLDLYARISTHSNYMLDLGTDLDLMYAGLIVESY